MTPSSTERPSTVAVILATTPAAGLACGDGTLLSRLLAQLARTPVDEVRVVARSAYGPAVESMAVTASGNVAEDLRAVAKTAREAAGPVAVLAGEIVAHDEALALLLSNPSRGTAALIAAGYQPEVRYAPIRVERGQIASAASSFHLVAEPNASFRGVLQVGVDDLESFASGVEELAAHVDAGRLGRPREPEVTALLLVGLTRSGVSVVARDIRLLHAVRVADQAGADAAMRGLDEVDEDKVRLDSAIKGDDGFFTTYFVSSWSRHLVRLAARLGLTPNAVTGISVGLAVIATLWFAAGTRIGLITGAVLLYLSFVLDCVDGQLARYTRCFSPLGAWLDATFDRLKEYLAYAGLAAGYAAANIWPLAVAALTVQTIRHMVDFSYAAAQTDAVHTQPPRPLDVRDDAALLAAVPAQRSAKGNGSSGSSGTSGATGIAVAKLSRRLDRRPLLNWAKKIVVLPIGERMALIAITAALFDARVTFLALLIWGGVAGLYTLTGRVLRSL